EVGRKKTTLLSLRSKLKNIMEEEVKLNLKLEKYVVLQGKLSVYHTEGFLGEGSYGTVVKCTKLDNEELVAVKVLRKDCFKEGKKEAKILRKILQLDPEKNNLLKFIESFKYKGYLCLAFEILDVSVFDFIKSRGFVPLSLSEIRVIAQQLLVALNALKSAGLVHADIKPDNIMFVNHRSQPLKVKLIDFGLAVKVSKLWFVGTVQAIGYRAPEVILGLKMDESVDMWSLGCSLAYMYLGYNLYPTHCVYEVIRAIVHIHGQPPDDVLNTPAEYTNTRPRPMNPMEREDSLGFISLLKQMLLVDPEVRITPGDALSHRFITMNNFSGERNDSCGASASKMVTDGKIHEFAVNHYVTSSEESKASGKALNYIEWKKRTIIKVKPYSAADQDRKDRADTEDASSKKARFTDTETSKKCSAAEREAIFCIERNTSHFVEVKARKTSAKKTWNFFSWLIKFISCNRKCD
uniref:Protein kinase domain-containing protein n=1 Tax=Xiphophorus maculatus TaxID=8083 RepID=A0A3B5Q384_XIPMA